MSDLNPVDDDQTTEIGLPHLRAKRRSSILKTRQPLSDLGNCDNDTTEDVPTKKSSRASVSNKLEVRKIPKINYREPVINREAEATTAQQSVDPSSGLATDGADRSDMASIQSLLLPAKMFNNQFGVYQLTDKSDFKALVNMKQNKVVATCCAKLMSNKTQVFANDTIEMTSCHGNISLQPPSTGEGLTRMELESDFGSRGSKADCTLAQSFNKTKFFGDVSMEMEMTSCYDGLEGPITEKSRFDQTYSNWDLMESRVFSESAVDAIDGDSTLNSGKVIESSLSQEVAERTPLHDVNEFLSIFACKGNSKLSRQTGETVHILEQKKETFPDAKVAPEAAVPTVIDRLISGRDVSDGRDFPSEQSDQHLGLDSRTHCLPRPSLPTSTTFVNTPGLSGKELANRMRLKGSACVDSANPMDTTTANILFDRSIHLNRLDLDTTDCGSLSRRGLLDMIPLPQSAILEKPARVAMKSMPDVVRNIPMFESDDECVERIQNHTHLRITSAFNLSRFELPKKWNRSMLDCIEMQVPLLKTVNDLLPEVPPSVNSNAKRETENIVCVPVVTHMGDVTEQENDEEIASADVIDVEANQTHLGSANDIEPSHTNFGTANDVEPSQTNLGTANDVEPSQTNLGSTSSGTDPCVLLPKDPTKMDIDEVTDQQVDCCKLLQSQNLKVQILEAREKRLTSQLNKKSKLLIVLATKIADQEEEIQKLRIKKLEIVLDKNVEELQKVHEHEMVMSHLESSVGILEQQLNSLKCEFEAKSPPYSSNCHIQHNPVIQAKAVNISDAICRIPEQVSTLDSPEIFCMVGPLCSDSESDTTGDDVHRKEITRDALFSFSGKTPFVGGETLDSSGTSYESSFMMSSSMDTESVKRELMESMVNNSDLSCGTDAMISAFHRYRKHLGRGRQQHQSSTSQEGATSSAGQSRALTFNSAGSFYDKLEKCRKNLRDLPIPAENENSQLKKRYT